MQNKTIELLEWSVASRARQGEELSGDHYYICPGSDRFLVAAIDGIGHGPDAALASRLAVSVLEANRGRSLPHLFDICHRALRITRGVVMSMALLNESNHTMTWLAVGNVQGRLLRMQRGPDQAAEELFLRSGVVGHNLPSTLGVTVLPIAKGDMLVLATDGIHDDFARNILMDRSTQEIADGILGRYANGVDDALVLVARMGGMS